MPEWHGPKFALTLVPYKILFVDDLPTDHPNWRDRPPKCLLGLLSPTGRRTMTVVDGPNDFVDANRPIIKLL